MSNAGSNARPTDAAPGSVRSHGRGGVASPALAAGRMLSAVGPRRTKDQVLLGSDLTLPLGSLRLSRWSSAGCGAGLTEVLVKSGLPTPIETNVVADQRGILMSRKVSERALRVARPNEARVTTRVSRSVGLVHG